MPSALMAFPSAAFYGGGLRAGAPTEETRPLDGVSEVGDVSLRQAIAVTSAL